MLKRNFDPNKPYRAVTYLRMSDEKQNPRSPDQQLAEIRRWLRVFVTRFFANQFKRSCMPDGPKVGSISLSPRGDWRAPSDSEAEVWLIHCFVLVAVLPPHWKV